MELRQLEYFVAVAESANFTRAAERVHITQSGVSAQIRQLEREVGAPLLDRSGRTVTLTAAGAAALPHARAALAAAAAVGDAVDDVTGLVRGRVVIGMIAGCRITPFFDALAAFHAGHPGIELTVVEDASDRLIADVCAGSMDGALIGAAAGPPGGLDALTIVSERLVALVPAGHPLARRRRVALADVIAHPLVCMPVGTGIRAVLDAACAEHRLTPRIALEASAPDAVLDLASRGLGIAVLTESMAADAPDLQAFVIRDVTTPATLAFVWRPEASPAMRAVAEHVRRAFDTAAAA
jgi:DNA-binding transcriptional LysR family regulator